LSTAIKFTGFPREGLDFLQDLRTNNNKAWFEAHRTLYENCLVTPARAFIMEMGRRLQTIAPDIIFDPRTDRSLFRIYRDVRFSKNKAPFKEHLGILFWEGAAPKLQCSGFYFQLEPDNMMLAAGLYEFTPELLQRYRTAIMNEKQADRLMKAIHTVQSAGTDYVISGDQYKRVPHGYDPNYQYARLLLFKSLGVIMQIPLPEQVYSADLTDFCLTHYKNMLPLHRWLVEMTA